VRGSAAVGDEADTNRGSTHTSSTRAHLVVDEPARKPDGGTSSSQRSVATPEVRLGHATHNPQSQ